MITLKENRHCQRVEAKKLAMFMCIKDGLLAYGVGSIASRSDLQAIAQNAPNNYPEPKKSFYYGQPIILEYGKTVKHSTIFGYGYKQDSDTLCDFKGRLLNIRTGQPYRLKLDKSSKSGEMDRPVYPWYNDLKDEVELSLSTASITLFTQKEAEEFRKIYLETFSWILSFFSDESWEYLSIKYSPDDEKSLEGIFEKQYKIFEKVRTESDLDEALRGFKQVLNMIDKITLDLDGKVKNYVNSAQFEIDLAARGNEYELKHAKSEGREEGFYWYEDGETPVRIGEEVCKDKAIDDNSNAPEATKEVESEDKMQSLQLVDASEYITNAPAVPDPILQGVFEKGDKVALLGASKTKKTFFFIELAMCLATGRDFIGLCIPKPVRVLFVNLEIKPEHFHRRISMMAEALNITPDAIKGKILILNARGAGFHWKSLTAYIQGIADYVDVVIIDPLYKLIEGDENSAKDMKPVLAVFDEMASNHNVAVLYTHHDAKGSPGDRNIRDRGAGSGVLARDYDAGITLTQHRSDLDGIVVEFLCRNFLSPPPIVVRFEEYQFNLADELTPETATGKAGNTSKRIALLAQVEQAKKIVAQKAWKKNELKIEITSKVPDTSASWYDRQILPALKECSEIIEETVWLGQKPVYLIGLEKLVSKEKLRLQKEYNESRQGKMELN